MLNSKDLVRTHVLLDKDLIKSIDEVAGMMSEDRSTAIRQLIKKAIASEKISLAVNKFQEGVSLRRASEVAGIDYWDFQLELDKRGIPLVSSIPLAERRIAKLKGMGNKGVKP